MKIFLDMIGCRLNQSEIEGFANLFRALGHEIVPEPHDADLAIINTCAVTVKAAADSRKHLRRSAREGARSVIATGCWATIEPDAARELTGVTQVVVNADKDHLVADLFSLPQEEIDALALRRDPLPGDRARTRAFIRVQEGCDNHCTYCLTRVARGISRSRPVEMIQKDIQAALDGGSVEIVLTGVQLGAWGRDFNAPQGLKDLIKAVLGHARLQRVRLSSIEPWDFDLSMLSLWQDLRLCGHLHIPLQSGSDRVLRKMGRPITISAYQALMDTIRQIIPAVAITTDVITGFPGERVADFEATKAILSRIGFSGGHVFTYSPRPGTPAFKMDEQVPRQVAKARNAALQDVFRVGGERYRDRWIGRTLTVLWESSEQAEDGLWHLSGLTDNYVKVYSLAEKDLWNKISSVRLMAHHPAGGALTGQIEPENEVGVAAKA
ncbi:MAG: MiaB/RimO family radical SAM methylthiotransferase [Brevefilum sp.]